MTSRRNNWKAAVIAMLFNSTAALAEPLSVCWTAEVPERLIDVDGAGAIHGAWDVSSGLLLAHLQRSQPPQGILLTGYDVLAARRICADMLAAGLLQTKIVFGGRERIIARQGAPAWDWLLVSIDALAANLLSGELPGIFIGEGKSVIGKGLEKSLLTDPRKVAAHLIDNQQRNYEPVVLFVAAEYQQEFFEFFSNNPLPGVYLSFDDAEVVRDALNKYASVSADDQARQLNYYCN